MALLQENLVVADRFRLVRMIGRGGMGSVWQAQHLGLDIPCAVKFIEGELANVAEAHARFEREAKAAAQLRSPNVVQIFDHGVWQGHPYIAMELLEGEDLGKRLAKSGGRLAPADVNFVVQNVCRALSRAHQAGVVHRDLKPDNVFVVKDDDRDIVKILDFGVAKSASQALDGSNTKTGAMLGTPYYMSPEQAQGIKSVDARSDLWSLAVIVFQALTGRLPFESEALGDLLVKIIVSPIPTPSTYFPMVPIGFDAWWLKAADRNPDNRFQTAKLFAESLSLSLGQSSVTDVTDRSRMHRNSDRPGGGTAMMVNAPGTDVMHAVPNTPHPGAHTAAMAMGTPNPAAHAHAHTPQPMNTPQGMQMPQGGPMGPPPGAPPPGHGHAGYMQSPPHATTGNPVANTYSGLDGPPKKVPVALFVGVGLLAVIGLGLGTFALMSHNHSVATTSAGASADPAASGATSAVATAPTAPSSETPGAAASVAAKTPDPTPDPPSTGAASAAPSASVASVASAVPAVPHAGGGGGGGGHGGGGGAGTHGAIGAKTGAVAPPPPPPPTTAAAATAATPPKGKEKPINLGF
jgi:serine/threonine protein kinase